MANSDLNISLEPHLADALRDILPLLPDSLSKEVSRALSSAADASNPSPTVPYDVLAAVSRWARTPAGIEALSAHTPPPDAGAYTMVALLAGTRSAPDKKFPGYVRPRDPALEARREVGDRRAVIAVLNGLLSVGCVGAAVWWAARYTGWRDEWRALLSLLAAVIVAISEVGLYIIWEARRSAKKGRARRRVTARHKRNDDDGLAEGNDQLETEDSLQGGGLQGPLRQRVGTTQDDD
ncbi:hypothetical protein FA95DRAFT_1565773 [Auriscalpium vulgare]|uniref:Uncharacterized protein n=1 Tax=Auriscalpium vulgare TaxID=40419 RepID=A0ACB8RA91_9AGAM|nr:hypothetical protein FA95DRAFT_1565773 [Auriscalpium vulgare]